VVYYNAKSDGGNEMPDVRQGLKDVLLKESQLWLLCLFDKCAVTYSMENP
jgi:hypothetical protein